MLNESPDQPVYGTTLPEPSVRQILIIARPDFSVDGMVSLLRHHQDRYRVSVLEPEHFSAALVREHCPDVLLLNRNITSGSLDDYFDEIRQVCNDAIVLLFGNGMDDSYLFSAMRAGARGYLNEKMRGDHLTTALDTVINGGYWAERHILCQFISDQSVHAKIDGNINRLSDRLTTRESEVLELILCGMTTNEIAERIFLSHQGVKAHLTNLFRKFEVKNRAQLILTVMNEVCPVYNLSGLVEKGLKSARESSGRRHQAA